MRRQSFSVLDDFISSFLTFGFIYLILILSNGVPETFDQIRKKYPPEQIRWLNEAIQILDNSGMTKINDTAWIGRNRPYRLRFRQGGRIECLRDSEVFFLIEYPFASSASFTVWTMSTYSADEFLKELQRNLLLSVICSAQCGESILNVTIIQHFNMSYSQDNIYNELEQFSTNSGCYYQKCDFFDGPYKQLFVPGWL